MKKNLYYQTMFRRRNAFKEFLLGLFFSLCSVPRLLLEVFIRRNFGERYFSFSTGMIAIFILSIIPALNSWLMNLVAGLLSARSSYGIDLHYGWPQFLLNYLTWYIFLGAFFVMCIRRRNEIRNLPSVFDFARFSLSTGLIHPGFLNYKYHGRPLSIRQIETVLEPGFFLVIGLALWLLQQSIGTLLVFCSICYSMSYRAAYYNGDNFVMDKIDEMISNEELVSSFVDCRGAQDTRGFNYYGRRPADPELRRKLAESFTEEYSGYHGSNNVVEAL